MITRAAGRLLTQDALGIAVVHESVHRSDEIAQAPTAGTMVLPAGARGEVGVWELSPGEVTDVELDEVFVVLAGKGEVEFEDGSVLQLGPATVVRLRAGDRTRWSIEETLRKVYVLLPGPTPDEGTL